MGTIRGIIDTDKFSTALRARMIDRCGRFLVTSHENSEQVQDLADLPNCENLGRIRHFRRETSVSWPKNPLPIEPATRALGLPFVSEMRTQLFQNAGCDWRCWYCYVPFDRLAADSRYSKWVTADDLVLMYRDLSDRPSVLVLSGGQPDLTPEWIPRSIDSLRNYGIDESTYLWSDDNLSNDYYWRHLSAADRKLVRTFPNYGRVGCFKGFDEHSFAFNTQADPSLFLRQFEIMDRLINEGIDVYGYATFTSDIADGVESHVGGFIDRLRAISSNLPLRVIPLKIESFTPVRSRIAPETFRCLDSVQHRAIAAWTADLARHYSTPELTQSIVDVRL